MRRLILLAAALAVAACQPAGGPALQPSGDEPAPATSEELLGAPGSGGVPQSIDQLVQLGRERAQTWQDDPVLTELIVEVGEDGAWSSAEVTFAAGEAARLFQVTANAEGISETRPSLATLQLQPVPPEALEDVPELPEDVRTPAALAASEGVRECIGGPGTTVHYTTGAPYAWDGEHWTQDPAWVATVGSGGKTATLNPASGKVGDCS